MPHPKHLIKLQGQAFIQGRRLVYMVQAWDQIHSIVFKYKCKYLVNIKYKYKYKYFVCTNVFQMQIQTL